MGASNSSTNAPERDATVEEQPPGYFASVGPRTRDVLPATLVSVALIAISTVIVGLSSPNHIEFADQALYLLMIDEPPSAIRSASGFHVLLSPLFSLVGESVVGFRLLRAFLDIGVDVLFGFSLLRYLRSRGASNGDSSFLYSSHGAVLVVSSVTLGGFAAWIYAVNGFGYDQLGAIIFTLLGAALLRLVSTGTHHFPAERSEHEVNKDPLLGVLVGALFMLAAIVRWTAAVPALALCTWVLVEHLGIRQTRALLARALVGAIATLAIIHVALIDITELFSGIRSGTADIRRDSHSLDVLLIQYIKWLVIGAAACIWAIIPVGYFAIVSKVRDRIPFGAGFVAVTPGILLLIIAQAGGVASELRASMIGTSLALTCAALVFSIARSDPAPSKLSGLGSRLSLPVTLTALPILMAMGSLLPPVITALPLATTWIAVMWLVLPGLPNGPLRRVGITVGIITLSAMPWFVWVGLDSPARTPWADTTTVVERGRFEGLRVDETTQQLLHDLEDLRSDLDPNPTVLSFWTRPVVPFALEGTGIGFPWYHVVNAPNAAAVSISGACLDDGDTPTGDVVIVTEDSNPAAFGPIDDALRDCGIDFPNGFELVSTMIAPDDTGPVELFVYVRYGGQ